MKLSINGEEVMSYTDLKLEHGMFGFALSDAGECQFEKVEVRS